MKINFTSIRSKFLFHSEFRLLACSAILAIGLSACTSFDKHAQTDPFLGTTQKVEQTTKPTLAEQLGLTVPARSLQTTSVKSQPKIDSTRLVSFETFTPPETEQPIEEKKSTEKTFAVVTVGRIGMPTRQSIQQVNYTNQGDAVVNLAGGFSGATISLESRDWPALPDPRVPVEQLKSMKSPERIADEYLFDGGDRSHPVHYSKFSREGLDTEDTIAEFNDTQGKRHVKTSNRVAIYSPRFAAVRSISEPTTHNSIHKIAGAVDRVRTSGLESRLIPSTQKQNDQLLGTRVRERVSAFDTDSITGDVEQVVRTGNHIKLQNTFQDFSSTSSSRLMLALKEKTAKQLQFAIAWTRDQNPIITASTERGIEMVSKFREDELVGVDDKHKQPGKMKIIKLADKQTAARGEIITFTIRFSNEGDKELRNVRIIDNLTPRLEFIEGSDTCDRKGKLSVEDNGEGSLVLQWNIEEPLKGQEQGVVTFKTRVK